MNVLYPRDLRSDPETLGRVLVMTSSGAQVPLAQVADIRTVTGPSMIRNENDLLVGYALEWSGQYENMQRVTERLKLVGRLRSMADLHEAIVHGAVERLRPKMMTVTAAMVGLMPIKWSIGTGSDVMKRVAAPMVGGLATSFALELLVYPAIYLLWRWHTQVRHEAAAVPEP